MSGRQILPILLFGAVAGWFGPDLAAPSSSLTPDEIAARDKAEAEHRARIANMDTNRKESWVSGDTVLRRESDGHFYATVLVEGRDYRFLVDTGASIVALTAEDARAMGLEWDESRLMPVGRGASGDVYGVPAWIDRLEVGGIEARDVEAVIIPEGLDVSLLGQSILSRFPDVAISGNEMKLGG